MIVGHKRTLAPKRGIVSSKFYLTGVQGFYPVTNFMEMEDVDFNVSGQ